MKHKGKKGLSIGITLVVLLGLLPAVVYRARLNFSNLIITRSLLSTKSSMSRIAQIQVLKHRLETRNLQDGLEGPWCESQRTRARLAIASVDYDDAIRTLLRVIEDCPAEQMDDFWLGQAYQGSGQWENAILKYREVKAILALQELGDTLVRERLWSDALQSYTAALELRSNDCANHVRVGNAIWRDQLDATVAVTHFSQAVELCPDELWGYSSAARMLVEAGDYAEAESWAKLGMSVDPASDIPLTILGLSRLRQHRFEEAVIFLSDALDMNPDSAEAHALLGSAYLNLEKWVHAADELELAIRLDPMGAWIFAALGNTYENMGMSNDAIHAYRKALELESSRQDAIDGLHRMLELK